jgi:4-aminobutyrate aminotransferase-like enzyme/Ser/Thr protein kinase RdoA (MazF antagonist)
MSRTGFYQRPAFTPADALHMVRAHYGLEGQLASLPGERDQNFHLTTPTGAQYVLKIARGGEDEAVLLMENLALAHVGQQAACPQPLINRDGQTLTAVINNGHTFLARLISYLPGDLYAHVRPQDARLQRSLGRRLGQLDRALATFSHPAARRQLKWDLSQAAFIVDYTQYIPEEAGRRIVAHFLDRFVTAVQPALPHLRRQIIHNDANDYNLLVSRTFSQNEPVKASNPADQAAYLVAAIIDFGDMMLAPTVCEVAIGAAYALLDQPDPLLAAAQVVAGYHEVYPLLDDEIALLFHLIAMRLCVSVTIAAANKVQEPDNAYLQISAQPAWDALEKLAGIDPDLARALFRHACGLPPFTAGQSDLSHLPQKQPGVGALADEENGQRLPSRPAAEEILAMRQARIGPSLTVAYERPLHITRGYMQYLYDEDGRAYLDAVNNVSHVGHCHPRVVRAGQTQMALLNTNSRYLHRYLVEYAARLTAKLPDPLDVVYFVCSGSEANELALRLARTYTGHHDILVLAAAYHGNTGELVNISPYKFNGRGGQGAPPYVHVLPLPDPYRGPYKGYGRETGRQYVAHVTETVNRLQAQAKAPAAFITESLPGCAGQIVLPDGYLAAAFAPVRAAGGVCIADEVQVGFGRVGSHFWGFETQAAVPDIVTLGKPMGNGHPLAAVVTTRAIAAAFANGMEYFNTFGGNPVSCAIGLAVLDVIEEEQLQQNALIVGDRLLNGLRRLQAKYPLIGDVRGRGLYIGVELVRDQNSLEPATREANIIVNAMKEHGILISTDGPLHNVLKIKPPLVFTPENADFLVETVDVLLERAEWR